MTIKIGDTIRHKLWGTGVLIGRVEEIELCAGGEKYGEKVNCAVINEQNPYSQNYVFCLDNGHWCYGNQIIDILN